MKKILRNALFMLVSVALVASCSDGEDNFHTFGATSSINPGPIVSAYADQVVDSVQIVTTDGYKATTTAPWLLFATNDSQSYSKDLEYKYHNIYTHKIYMSLIANSGTAMRSAAIKFDSNGHTTGLQYQQAYWMNITDPAPEFANAETYAGVKFNKEVSARAMNTSVIFHVYAPATLTSDAEWARPAAESFDAGIYTVQIDVDDNTTGAPRQAKLTLLSSTKAKSVIVITQKEK